MESFSPTSAFISVDFPTFGLPMMQTNPERCAILHVSSHLQDVRLALGEVAPFALLEPLLGQAREVDAVECLDGIAEGLENAPHDAVLA